MKKKNLKSLSSIQKYLVGQGLDSAELSAAFLTIQSALNGLADEKEKVPDILPIPAEISSEPETIALYSDGGCRGNPGPGAYAFVVQEYSGEILAEGVEYESFTTNNKMELSGPLKGLSELCELLQAKGRNPLLTKVKVVTDSKYVVEGMSSWVKGWKSRGWKKADNKTPENIELWQALDEAKNLFKQVDWMWIKGHAGHPQNEYCDRKANEVMDAHSAD